MMKAKLAKVILGGIVLCAVAAGCGSTGGTVRTSGTARSGSARGAEPATEPTTTVPASAAVDKAQSELVAFKTEVGDKCGRPKTDVPPPAPPKVDLSKPVVVGLGPNCESGLADPSVLGSKPAPVTPILALDGSGTTVGYWVDGVGWITPAQHDSPDFDPNVWQEAARRAFSPSDQTTN